MSDILYLHIPVLVGGDLCPSTHIVAMLPGLHISWRSAACEEATAPAT